ncbi:unnamed protein product [Amoebophrya sp. A25]|nr:unnamed protein product [Amoebophrya sp. A25]|eukprot:GSA25T00019227001.1
MPIVLVSNPEDILRGRKPIPATDKPGMSKQDIMMTRREHAAALSSLFVAMTRAQSRLLLLTKPPTNATFNMMKAKTAVDHLVKTFAEHGQTHASGAPDDTRKILLTQKQWSFATDGTELQEALLRVNRGAGGDGVVKDEPVISVLVNQASWVKLFLANLAQQNLQQAKAAFQEHIFPHCSDDHVLHEHATDDYETPRDELKGRSLSNFIKTIREKEQSLSGGSAPTGPEEEPQQREDRLWETFLTVVGTSDAETLLTRWSKQKAHGAKRAQRLQELEEARAAKSTQTAQGPRKGGKQARAQAPPTKGKKIPAAGDAEEQGQTINEKELVAQEESEIARAVNAWATLEPIARRVGTLSGPWGEKYSVDVVRLFKALYFVIESVSRRGSKILTLNEAKQESESLAKHFLVDLLGFLLRTATRETEKGASSPSPRSGGTGIVPALKYFEDKGYAFDVAGDPLLRLHYALFFDADKVGDAVTVTWLDLEAQRQARNMEEEELGGQDMIASSLEAMGREI